MEKIAVISLGTTKIDLILANVLPTGNYVVFDEMSETIKISQDMEKDGFIKPVRIAEAISILKIIRTSSRHSVCPMLCGQCSRLCFSALTSVLLSSFTMN